MEQHELVDQRPDWFKHEDADGLRFSEIDREPNGLGMLGDQRLDGKAALRERSAAGTHLDQDAGSEDSRPVGGWVVEDSCALDTPCSRARVGLAVQASRCDSTGNERLESGIFRLDAASREYCNEVYVFREAFDEVVCLGKAGAALKDNLAAALA